MLHGDSAVVSSDNTRVCRGVLVAFLLPLPHCDAVITSRQDEVPCAFLQKPTNIV